MCLFFWSKNNKKEGSSCALSDRPESLGLEHLEASFLTMGAYTVVLLLHRHTITLLLQEFFSPFQILFAISYWKAFL